MQFPMATVKKNALYVPDDVLEEASSERYQMLPKKSNLRYQKEFKKLWVNERQ
jgi:hypothetical protein